MEKWKDIPNYENIYQVSNLGRIKTLSRYITNRHGTQTKTKEKILKTRLNIAGYVLITLNKGGILKTFSVHRLVGKSFIENKENKRYLNHINCDKTDNRVENLEWCTAKENIDHSILHGLNKGFSVKLTNLKSNIVHTFNSMEETDNFLKRHRGYTNNARRRKKKNVFIHKGNKYEIKENWLKEKKMNKVRELRKHFTKIKLAKMLKVSLNTIDKWENEVTKPNDINKEKLNKLYEEVIA